MTVKAIDPWVNVSMGAMVNTPFMQKVKEEYFKAGDDFFRNIEADELVERMDAIGVEKSFLTVDPYRPEQRILDFTTKYPGRFYIAAQPRLKKGMKALCWNCSLYGCASTADIILGALHCNAE